MSTPDLQPVLNGPHVTVRPIVESDWDGLYAVASDPQVWALHPAKDRYQEAVFHKFFDEAIASGSGFSFVDKASGKLIGSSRYNGFNPQTSEIEIGWTFLGRDYWGGAYNGEIKKLMLEHAFTFVDTVVFWVGDSNWRSRKAVEKIGGQLRDGIFHRNPEKDDPPHVIYELTRATMAL